jgi:hypothetical protein
MYTSVPAVTNPPPDSLKRLGVTFTYAAARAAGVSKRVLYRLREQGEIETIARGVYRKRDSPLADEGLLAVAARIPKATLCLTSALVRHELLDAIPSVVDLAIPRGNHAPRMGRVIRWHRFGADTFDLGRGLVAIDPSISIGLYSAERSIVDAFRMRKIIGPEIGNEALKNWLRRRGARPSKLLTLVKHFPSAEPLLRGALELLL